MDKFSAYKRIITFALILSSSLSFAGGSLDLNVGRTLCDTCQDQTTLNSAIHRVKELESSRRAQLSILTKEVQKSVAILAAEKSKCDGLSLCERRIELAASQLSQQIKSVAAKHEQEFVKAKTLISEFENLKNNKLSAYDRLRLSRKASNTYYNNVRLSKASESRNPQEIFTAFFSGGMAESMKIDSLHEMMISPLIGEIVIIGVGNKFKESSCPEMNEAELFNIHIPLYSRNARKYSMSNSLEQKETKIFMNRESGLKLSCQRVNGNEYVAVKMNLKKNAATVFYTKDVSYRQSEIGIFGGVSREKSYRYPRHRFAD